MGFVRFLKRQSKFKLVLLSLVLLFVLLTVVFSVADSISMNRYLAQLTVKTSLTYTEAFAKAAMTKGEAKTPIELRKQEKLFAFMSDGTKYSNIALIDAKYKSKTPGDVGGILIVSSFESIHGYYYRDDGSVAAKAICRDISVTLLDPFTGEVIKEFSAQASRSFPAKIASDNSDYTNTANESLLASQISSSWSSYVRKRNRQ